MKAEIDTEGMLHVHPENCTEAWALRSWWEKFRPQYPGESTGIAVHHKNFEESKTVDTD